MVPPAKPLAAGWKSPVHLSAAGSQTSIFTSVSPAREARAVTRQKAGRSANRAALGGLGGTNAPSPTISAAAMRAPFSGSDRRRSHRAADELWARAPVEHATSTAPAMTMRTGFFMERPGAYRAV